MNSEMKAAALVIATAKDVVSEAGRCRKCRCDGAVIPSDVLGALADALDEYDVLANPAPDPCEDEDGPTRIQRIVRMSRP